MPIKGERFKKYSEEEKMEAVQFQLVNLQIGQENSQNSDKCREALNP